MRSYWASRAVKDEEARTCCSLVNRADEPLFELLLVSYEDLCILAVFGDAASIGGISRASHSVLSTRTGREWP